MNVQTLVRYVQESRGMPDGHPPVDIPNWVPDEGLQVHGDSAESRRIIPLGPNATPALETDVELVGLHPGEGPQPGELEKSGTDALAFYLPFHFYRDIWGIHIRASGLLYLARILGGGAASTCNADSLSSSWRVLNDHEQFHFVVEAGASLLELNDIHQMYAKHVGDRTARHHEEALCNAHSFRRGKLGEHKQFKTEIAGFMSSQGPGYCEYHRYVSRQAFAQGQRELGKGLLIRSDSEGMPSPGFVEITKLRLRGRRDDWPGELVFSPFAGAAVARQVPRYLVLDVPVPYLRMIRSFPKAYGLQVFVHANDHRPPHFHVNMPPGRPLGRYQWPSLDPVPGDAALTGSARKSLEIYLSLHGKTIEKRIRTVYPGAV